MSRFDAVVVGGGPNGLVGALALRRAGLRVALVEARDAPGGLAAPEVIHPGFRGPGPLHDDAPWRFDLLADLLPAGALRPRSSRPDVLALGGPEPRRLAGDPRADDDPGRRALAAFVDSVRPAVVRLAGRRPPDPVLFESNRARDLLAAGTALRGLGGARMLELLRVPALPVADWLAEWIDDPAVAAALALPAAAATFAGPASPGTAAVALLDDALGGPGVEGGPTAVVDALAAAIEEAGVVVRAGVAATRLDVEGGRVRGVRLGDGASLPTPRVLVTCHPAGLLDLLDPGALPSRTAGALRALRSRGTTAHLLVAAERPFAPAGVRVERARIAGDVSEIERAFDDAKHGRLPELPVLDVHAAAATRPDLAPAGAEMLSVLIGFVPPPGTIRWDDGAREALRTRVEERLEREVPGFRRSIVARRLLTPEDISDLFALPGGCLRHTEHALDQLLVRPAPGLAGWLTPIRGLALGGSGCHPGGGLSGAPGRLAADALLAQPDAG